MLVGNRAARNSGRLNKELTMPPRDPFLTRLYDRLHDTPTQRKFRRIAPIPVGVVFQEWPGMTLADMRRDFRLMRKLGFTCLKQCLVLPGTDRAKVMHAALDEGLLPWWYDEGGWEEITPALLRKLRIAVATPIERLRADRRLLDHQMRVMRRRIDRGEPPDKGGAAGTEIDGLKLTPDHRLDEAAIPHFVRWAKKTYRTVARAVASWNNRGRIDWTPPDAPRTWKELESRLADKSVGGSRLTRDVLRCKADLYLQKLRARVAAWKAHDPDAPFRAGGEMGLFLPFASRATDMEGIADVMADYGSFYPSIHLSWHFEEVGFEITRPAYMQAQFVADLFKGGWSAAWESTGGPQQFSGGKAPFWPPAQDKIAGFTVDAGVMTQLMLSYLAGGFRGFGFWCWSSPHGAGEFGVLDRQRRPTDRAVQMGRIGQAARRWRDELWLARKEPLVGIYTDFDNDAMWAAMASGGRDLFKHVPMKARVGTSRALINHNVPWEYVTGADLAAGLADRYRVIYLPVLLSIRPDFMKLLHGYVRRGGRLVLDMPAAWFDDHGRSLNTDRGTLFERTFGCMVRDYQYSSNVPRHLAGRQLAGWVADLGLTHARALATFDNGWPAITESRVGKGTAIVLGFEASLACFAPGDARAQQLLVDHALGDYRSPYACDGAIVYRLAAPLADHYFLINDGPARSVTLDTKNYRYASAMDAVSGKPLALGGAIDLPPYSGRWVRCAK
jgi:beta-galactosidase